MPPESLPAPEPTKDQQDKWGAWGTAPVQAHQDDDAQVPEDPQSMEPERADTGAEQTAPEIEPTIEEPTGGGGEDQEVAEVASPNAPEVVMHRLLVGTSDAPRTYAKPE